MIRSAGLLIVLFATITFAESSGEAGRYQESADYVASAFPGASPKPGILWVGGNLRDKVERVLGHRFDSLRVRYWDDGTTSVWILDEIGKELPITIGVTVTGRQISNVRVLEFRESRGWEVRYPFFTDQFDNASLDADGRLNRDIDGITGATLSVRAVTRTASVALIFDDSIRKKTQQ